MLIESEGKQELREISTYSQFKALQDRRLKIWKRNKWSAIFELLIPAGLILVGLCFTVLQFQEVSHSRVLSPVDFPSGQSILVNKHLYKNLHSKQFDDQEHFDGEDFGDEPTPPSDLEPLEILKNFPNASSFHFELLDLPTLYN